MNFYIIDDDQAVPLVLQQIIEQDHNAMVVGTNQDALSGLQAVLTLDVDILLVDLLMPELSGIDLVLRLKQQRPQIKVIMISQVRDLELREKAYQAGIEFFIDKPINVIEVKTVIEKVRDSLQMQTKLAYIQSLVGSEKMQQSPPAQTVPQAMEQVRTILKYLGISTEAGTADILFTAEIMLEHHLHFNQIDFEKQYTIDQHEKKIIFQRMRRAMKKGLTNLATRQLDDFNDDIALDYGNILYDYKNVRMEMLYLKGQHHTHGKVALRKFMEGLILMAERE